MSSSVSGVMVQVIETGFSPARNWMRERLGRPSEPSRISRDDLALDRHHGRGDAKAGFAEACAEIAGGAVAPEEALAVAGP